MSTVLSLIVTTEAESQEHPRLRCAGLFVNKTNYSSHHLAKKRPIMYLQAIIAASLLQLRTCARKYSTSVIPRDYVVQFLRQIKADNSQAWCARYDNLHCKPKERVMKFPRASDTAVGDGRRTDTGRQIVQRRRVKSRWPRCLQQNNGSQGIHCRPITERQKKKKKKNTQILGSASCATEHWRKQQDRPEKGSESWFSCVLNECVFDS